MNTAAYVGPYRLLERIGSGGMGTVYVAIHEHTDHKVAIKLLSPETARDPQNVARFLQEGRALASLDHHGVVKVLGCERLDDESAYLAMELLDGISLRQWLQHERKGSLDDALALARQIADAMTRVHELGIVHRDLKPENVFLVGNEQPGEWRVKILDFGVAKVPAAMHIGAVDTRVETRAPTFLGTAAYMAPEQCRAAADVTDRADVYSLGVVLFELLAGEPPFTSPEAIEVASMHLHAQPPWLRERDASIPTGLDVLVTSMLDKEAIARPSMRRVREVLGQDWERRPGERVACPLPGLRPFSERHAELLFGRERDVEAVVSLLDRARADRDSRWVVVEGRSGVGKVSLVHAGVLPALKDTGGASRWRIARLGASDDPLRELSHSLADALAGDGLSRSREDIERALRDDPNALGSLAATHVPDGCALLVVVDRLGELFAAGTAARAQLDALLSHAASAGAPVCVLATLRPEIAHRLGGTPGVARAVEQAARHQLRAMDEPALVSAIEQMAQRAGMHLADGLAARMVRDASGSGSHLPLLGHTLRGLWTPRPKARVTHEDYERTGGASGALARHAASLLDSLGERGRERAKWAVLSLVQVGRGVPDTRRPRTEADVVRAAGGDDIAKQVLMRLLGAPGKNDSADGSQGLQLLVRTGGAGTAGKADGAGRASRRVELVHDTLLRQVPTIAAWIDSERALLERYADVEIAAQAWEQSGCPADGLPSGTFLHHYAQPTGEASAGERREALQRVASEQVREFIDAAVRLDRRRRRIRRAAAGALLALAVALAVAAVYARREQARAEDNAQLARREQARAEANAQRARDEQARAENSLLHLATLAYEFVSDADWPLSRLHGTLAVRRMMLDRFEGLLPWLNQTAPHDLRIRVIAIEILHRRGDLAWHDETLADAERRFDEAAIMIAEALARWPGDDELLDLRAMNHSKQGKVALARRDLPAAAEHFASALARMKPALDEADDDSRRALATSKSEQAELDLARGAPGEALRLHDEALALLEPIGDDDYDRSLTATTSAQSAAAARLAGDLTTAAERIDRALATQRAIAGANPGNAFYQWGLGYIHVELGEVRLRQGRLAEAAAQFALARELGRDLNAGDPTTKRYALVLGASLRGLAKVAEGRGALAEAAGARRECQELFNKFREVDPADARFAATDCR